MDAGSYLIGNTGLGDSHRIDTYVLKDVPAGKVINVFLQDNQLQQPGAPDVRLEQVPPGQPRLVQPRGQPRPAPWEAVSFLCVVSGDYYIQVKPIAGQGTITTGSTSRSSTPRTSRRR